MDHLRSMRAAPFCSFHELFGNKFFYLRRLQRFFWKTNVISGLVFQISTELLLSSFVKKLLLWLHQSTSQLNIHELCLRVGSAEQQEQVLSVFANAGLKNSHLFRKTTKFSLCLFSESCFSPKIVIRHTDIRSSISFSLLEDLRNSVDHDCQLSTSWCEIDCVLKLENPEISTFRLYLKWFFSVFFDCISIIAFCRHQQISGGSFYWKA